VETTTSLEHRAAQRSGDGATSQSEPALGSLSRRGFLARAGGVAAATATAGTLGTLPLGTANSAAHAAAASAPRGDTLRADQAYSIRVATARAERARPLPGHSTNGDEARYAPTYLGSFTKGLPHTARGEVDPAAYAALLTALASARPADFEAIPLGGTAKLVDPQAAYAFVLEGPDTHCLAVSPPPAFSSAQEAAEMAELYWQALARDVPFARYDRDPVIGKAAADLARLSDFRGPTAGGAVTPATIFRTGLPGDRTGPYLAQFLWLPVPYGPLPLVQRYPVAPRRDYLATYAAWLTVQQGHFSPAKPAAAASPPTRYLSTGRDLASYLHTDFTYQACVNACLILNQLVVDTRGAPLDAGNPYRHSRAQAGFATFGAPHALDLVARVANAALKAVWYQKWLVHRRLRPEEFGGRVHQHKMGAAAYPIHADLLTRTGILEAVYQQYGSYLLPMADPEGAPLHPAYPAGHMAIAGACVTVLKAFFDEAFVLPHPVVARLDGRTLHAYSGPALTVGDELNKLAGNIAMGRAFEGLHWRSDGLEGLRLGEAVALGILADERATFNGRFGGFSLTRFDGTTITL
jgi:hypothetical protein